MAPNRFRRDQREKREVTPFTEETVVPDIPPEWRDLEAPINFTWVVQDELAGMGWPKSRDQLRFLISQGIDHLVTLSSDKLPPYYAFPELKWTMIPVEDFTGPTISEIKKFIGIIDEARRNGEGVGVHCAEGRGRTGVMCACYLIYYHDIAPWDAIRIMRRQRPGSVERKVQEETVVKFYTLLNDFGRDSLEDLEVKEKKLKEMMQKRQLQALQYDANLLLLHTTQFYGPQQNTSEHKAKRLEKFERMRRAKSMPKMDGEEELQLQEEAGAFQNHVQSFFTADQRSRSQPRPEKGDRKGNENDDDRRQRAVTPGRTLLGEISNLKPVGPRRSVVASELEPKANDFTKHFKDFMTTPAAVKNLKRHRSFSNTRDKDNNKDETARSSEEEEKGMGDSTESEKDVRPTADQNKKNGKPQEDSRCSSPEVYQSEKDSGSEEASSVSSQQTVETESRPRPGLNTSAIISKAANSVGLYSSKGNSTLPQNNHIDLKLNKKSSAESNLNVYSRKTSSSDLAHNNHGMPDLESTTAPKKLSTSEIKHDFLPTASRYTRKTSTSKYDSMSSAALGQNLTKDYSIKDYSHNDYSKKDYSTKDYSTKDYSTKDYLAKDYSTRDYSTKDYSTKDYSVSLRKSSNESSADTAGRYSRKSSNTEYDTILNGHDYDRRRHSAPTGNQENHDEQNPHQQPPPPTYKPKCTVDTSTTYSYYTRIRSRAEETRRREAETEKNDNHVTTLRSVAMSPVLSARTFTTRRARAATIERDMEVTVTVTENPATTESNTSWRTRIYGEASREIASYYPVRRRRPQSPETVKTVTPPESQSSSARTSRSHYRRTSSGPLPEVNNNDPNCQSKNSQDINCYRKTSVDGATLNGHRNSLLGGISGESLRGVISDGRNALRRSREENATSSSTVEAALRSQKSEDSHQLNGMRPRERAKSEGKVLYEPDEASGRTGAGGEKENHFLNAAKKWASYEKPVSYSAATLSREGWKRTHRKFNYSRFLNYTKETYV